MDMVKEKRRFEEMSKTAEASLLTELRRNFI
jgi:hypothetical protein